MKRVPLLLIRLKTTKIITQKNGFIKFLGKKKRFEKDIDKSIIYSVICFGGLHTYLHRSELHL